MTDSELPQLLESIEAGLTRLGQTTLVSRLLPGRSPESTEALLRSYGLSASPELEQLYAWHDGSDLDGITIGQGSLFPGYYFNPLQESLQDYGAFERDQRWSKGWFPVLADGGGDFYVAELGRGSAGTIRDFLVDETEHPIVYENLTALFRTVAQAFERGLIFRDADGYLNMDYNAYNDLAAELNPTIEWWTEPVE